MTTPATPTGTPAGADVTVSRGGDASDEEVAAIVAAVEVAWPRPAAPAASTAPPRWRFSGRWWTKPVPLRRNRPW
ncbi:MAG TPA: hypothetical protein VFY82_16000 [Acidimicrobiales bacterium]|nr:hypothetical protein [Acidimicrobiales bacterium]